MALERMHLQECGEWNFKLFSPEDPEQRGSQISICHKHGYAIVQVLLQLSGV